jgi:alanyl aminopeptidase
MCVRWMGADGKPQHSCALVTKREQDLTLGTKAGCPTWLLANDGEVGYYRAAYAAGALQALLGADGRKLLDLPETVGLLDDVRALVRAGRLVLGDVLALTPSLSTDSRRQVQTFVLGTIDGLHHYLVPAADRPNYARYIGKLYDDTRLLRPTLVGLVADQGEDKKLAAEARTLAAKWLGDRKALSPDVVGAVLEVAARTGDRALFDRMRAEAKRASDRHERQQILRAIGEFRDPAIARSALQIVSSTEFDPRESMEILWGLSEEAATRELAWDYLKANFDTLVKRLSAEQMAYTPFMGAGFCDESHERDMEAFFKDRSPKLPGGPRLLMQASEDSQLCRAYVAAQQPSVTAFLKKY